MRKIVSIFLVVLLLSQMFTVTAFAAGGQPVGGCPDGFDLHPFMEHMGDMHQHIGVDQDLNGDGIICMQVLSDDLHLHIDNVVPLS